MSNVIDIVWGNMIYKFKCSARYFFLYVLCVYMCFCPILSYVPIWYENNHWVPTHAFGAGKYQPTDDLKHSPDCLKPHMLSHSMYDRYSTLSGISPSNSPFSVSHTKAYSNLSRFRSTRREGMLKAKDYIYWEQGKSECVCERER